MGDSNARGRRQLLAVPGSWHSQAVKTVAEFSWGKGEALQRHRFVNVPQATLEAGGGGALRLSASLNEAVDSLMRSQEKKAKKMYSWFKTLTDTCKIA